MNMRFETTYKLEDFILNTRWEDLPGMVQERIKGCFLDLLGALLIGSGRVAPPSFKTASWSVLSPIIQDGKLVGAVTHVLVNDPTTGYGIFIENMLDAAA